MLNDPALWFHACHAYTVCSPPPQRHKNKNREATNSARSNNFPKVRHKRFRFFPLLARATGESQSPSCRSKEIKSCTGLRRSSSYGVPISHSVKEVQRQFIGSSNHRFKCKLRHSTLHARTFLERLEEKQQKSCACFATSSDCRKQFTVKGPCTFFEHAAAVDDMPGCFFFICLNLNEQEIVRAQN